MTDRIDVGVDVEVRVLHIVGFEPFGEADEDGREFAVHERVASGDEA